MAKTAANIAVSKFQDLSGRRFGRLVPSTVVGRRDGKVLWQCQCDCGTIADVVSTQLTRGKTKSCGCLRRELTGNRFRKETTRKRTAKSRKYRLSIPSRDRKILYGAWRGVLDRCDNSNGEYYHLYGGRGITVCDRWRHGDGVKKGFECFVEDMGIRPGKGYSLDRKNNDLGYSIDNCRWATLEEQNNNKRSVMKITFNGEAMSTSQWARRLGLCPERLRYKLKTQGMSLEEVISSLP